MIPVAVFDDNKPTADRIADTIPWQAMGCEVVRVEYDGIQAKRAISTYLPQIIISDIRMPGLTGLEIVELTRALIPNSKVIFISAYDEFEYAYRAIKLQAFDYLIKPFSQADLLAVVRRAARALRPARENQAAEPASQEHHSRCIRALEYFSHHLEKRLTLEELASIFSLSPRHLSRLIYQQRGKSFSDVSTQLRIERAKELLLDTDYNVAEISEMVGYRSYQSFYKVFVKQVGIPPTEFKKR